jgi:hypothetical protein
MIAELSQDTAKVTVVSVTSGMEPEPEVEVTAQGAAAHQTGRYLRWCNATWIAKPWHLQQALVIDGASLYAAALGS